MERKITDFLKEPLSGGELKLVPALLVFAATVFVNAYFQITSFSAMVSWTLKMYGVTDTTQTLTEILAHSSIAIVVRIAFGLLMTVFVMAFLLSAAYWDNKDKNVVHLFERACSTMLVPMLLMLVAALLMNVSLAVGVTFGIAAAVDCMAVIVTAGKKAKLNEHILIIIVTSFFLITVVLLTRNHFVMMIGAI